MTKNKIRLILYILSPAILFWLAWPPRNLFFLGFFAFVPLFLLEDKTKNIRRSSWLIYLSLLIWNIVISWWVGYAEFYSSIFMLLANSWLMYLPWLGYRKARNLVSDQKALFIFISLWLSFEYLHLNWQISWPWFTLGNIFAKHNEVVQWYEITGTLGGSLWVLTTNVLSYLAIQKSNLKSGLKPIAIIIIPILLSIPFYLSNQKDYTTTKRSTLSALLVQPNIDPYLKFEKDKEVVNLVDMLKLVEPYIKDSTDIIILPETAIVEYVDENYPDRFESIQLLKEFVKNHPQIHFISGISTYKFFLKGEPLSQTARKTKNGDYYDSYNTAISIDKKGNLDFYHKGKLVPGAEIMPYSKIFKFLDFLAVDLGGISGSLGSDKKPKVFNTSKNSNLAPLICYESVFPGHVAEFCREGAEILLVITNDGWWRDTDGYKQHMYYATLRAIENRREVLRSANTGISCRIDKLGKIHEQSQWWTREVIPVEVNSFHNLTFYSKYGDYIGRLASFIGSFFILGMIVKKKSNNVN